MTMKTLILPAEIKSRELDARLLHAALALGAGWRVITGSKALINRNIWRIPRGVYLMQTMTHKRLYMARLLKALNFKIIGWDEEGLVYLDKGLYLSRRISSETSLYIDQVFTWGRQGREDIAERCSSPVTPIGNPRFDMLRPEVRGVYGAQVDKIRINHGDFILVNTNFSSINPIISLHDAPERAISERDKGDGEKISQQYTGFLQHRQQMFDAFCEVMPKLAAAFPDRTIVIRPHPAEDLNTWQQKFKAIDNIKIIREGASIPWLLASKVLIHNGCTTAIESRLLGNHPLAFAPVSSSDHESPLPNGVSHMATGSGDLIALVEKGLAGSLAMTREQEEFLNQYVSGRTGPFAAQIALEQGGTLLASQRSSLLTTLNEIRLRALALGRYVYKAMRSNHRTDRYLKKVYPKTTAVEIEDRVNQLASELNLDIAGKIRARAIATNIFDLRVK